MLRSKYVYARTASKCDVFAPSRLICREFCCRQCKIPWPITGDVTTSPSNGTFVDALNNALNQVISNNHTWIHNYI